MDNETIIQKTLTTSDFFAGGLLNAEQQTRFLQLVREHAGFLDKVRVERVSQPTSQIDRLHLGEPITAGATENDDTFTFSRTKASKIDIATTKVRAAYAVTTESLQGNIEQDALEDTLVAMMTRRHAFDLELLSISGDDSIAATDPLSNLLKVKDGWDILTDGAHILDAGGNFISKGMLAEAARILPRQYRQDPDLMWIIGDTVWNDFLDLVSDRPTALGDAGFNQAGPDRSNGFRPSGYPVMVVPTIPDDKAVSVTEATSAVVVGTAQGPFEIKTGVNDTLLIDIDNAGAGVGVAVTLTAGVFFAVEIAKQINDTAGLAGVASANAEGQVVLTSPTTGATSEVDVQAANGNATLGLTVAVTTGSAAGVADDVFEGSFIWLANPKNFIWAVLDGTRIFAEFNKNFDRIEVVMYNHIDMKLENVDAIVKITNVRRKSLF